MQSEILDSLAALWRWLLRRPAPEVPGGDALSERFRAKYGHFQRLLESNTELLDIIADLEQKLSGQGLLTLSHIKKQCARIVFHAMRMTTSFEGLSGRPQPELLALVASVQEAVTAQLEARSYRQDGRLVLDYGEIGAADYAAVGGKNANLGEVRNKVGLAVPPGFAVTTSAYALYCAHNSLPEGIRAALMHVDPERTETLEAASEDIQRLFLNGEMPPELAQALDAAWDRVFGSDADGGSAAGDSALAALRSSALGEDGDITYAGQYLSVLGVQRRRLRQTYRMILASLYTPRAIYYRIMNGIIDDDIAMSVACVAMVDPVSSGVMYTRHPYRPPSQPGHDGILINSLWGLGPYVVDGVVRPDSFLVDRASLAVLEQTIEAKEHMLTASAQGTLQDAPVPPELVRRPSLAPEQVAELARAALRLEEHYGVPQDVEWAVDRQGGLVILQARPLHVAQACEAEEPDAPADCVLLFSGGEAAQPGARSGAVHLLNSEEDLRAVEPGAVLVMRHSSPKYVSAFSRASAIVAEVGSVTGHMASLCREFAIPTLFGVKDATRRFAQGQIVTVDASHGRIYEGRVPELEERLAPLSARDGAQRRATPVHALLAVLAPLITPLNLTDPRAPEFSPRHCRTIHDLMRYLHECSYGEMFKLSDAASAAEGGARRLRERTGLDLYVIDLGGGLAPSAGGGRNVRLEDIRSEPFVSLVRGLVLDDEHARTPRPVQVSGLASVIGQQMLQNPLADGQRFGDKSYAIISDKYVNFSSRIGYHYGILDSYCGNTVSKNYIAFSFKGGAADDVKRARRARAVGLILAHLGFDVSVIGDKVSGRLQKYSRGEIIDKLWLMGKLLQFTRQTDMLMTSEEAVRQLANCFNSGNYVLHGFCPITEKRQA